MSLKLLRYPIFLLLFASLNSCIKDDLNDSRAVGGSQMSIPTITTKSVTNVTQISATCGGRITSDGGSPVTSYGVCWSVNPNPTENDFKTVDGFGVGTFTSNISNLKLGTTYYLRAYARNSVGVAFGGQQTFTTSSALELGLNYEGGIIFYLDQSGLHGLVCAEVDQSNAHWGCTNTLIAGADATAVGGGAQNTDDILAGCTDAASAAFISFNLSNNGYSDWFLPSKEELKLMYTNLKVNRLGNFSDAAYWSSTEMTNVFAWQIDFNTGIIQGANKGILSSVRAARAF